MRQKCALTNFLKSKVLTCIPAILFPLLLFLSCQHSSDSKAVLNEDHWSWINTKTEEGARSQVVNKVLFGENDQLRLHQSMSVFDKKVFCFNDGLGCYVFGLDTKKALYSEKLLEYSHHNNSQFLDIFLNNNDRFPLLLLSRGDYPPSQNEFYLVRVEERNDTILFERIKTIKNTIVEAKNGGSWVVDTKTKTLYMYTMTNGDWRIADNKACIYSFALPDITDSKDVVLGYDDVINYWEYSYWIYQGGTFFNGYLFFNVQNVQSIYGEQLESQMNVLAINARDGLIEAVLPLRESMETEGISIYNSELFVSFKNGNPDQKETDTVFKVIKYSLPQRIINNNLR